MTQNVPHEDMLQFIRDITLFTEAATERRSKEKVERLAKKVLAFNEDYPGIVEEVIDIEYLKECAE